VIPRGEKIDGEYVSLYRSAGIIPFSFVDRGSGSSASSSSTPSLDGKELVFLLGQNQLKQKRVAETFLSALETSSTIVPSEPLVPQTTTTSTKASTSTSATNTSTSTAKRLYWSEFGGKKEEHVDKDIEATGECGNPR